MRCFSLIVIPHATDPVSHFQQAAVIPSKSSADVIDFLLRSWWPLLLLGAPRTIVADQGCEFISEEFQTFCSSHSVHHGSFGMPHLGRTERSGGTLLVAAAVANNVVIGKRDMSNAVSEACAAYNSDPNAAGTSPVQCMTGRRPASQGSVLNNFAGRLAEHGIIDSGPSLTELF